MSDVIKFPANRAFSKLRAFIVDHKDDEPGTVLQLEGLTDEKEVLDFMDALIKKGIVHVKAN